MAATLNDLNNALASAKGYSAGLVGTAQLCDSQITAALNRASQLPAPVDYQSQVDQVAAIQADLVAINDIIVHATDTATQILP